MRKQKADKSSVPGNCSHSSVGVWKHPMFFGSHCCQERQLCDFLFVSPFQNGGLLQRKEFAPVRSEFFPLVEAPFEMGGRFISPESAHTHLQRQNLVDIPDTTLSLHRASLNAFAKSVDPDLADLGLHCLPWVIPVSFYPYQ